VTVPATGPLSQMFRQLHFNTIYRVSVSAVTGAGPGQLLFVDGKTRPRSGKHSVVAR